MVSCVTGGMKRLALAALTLLAASCDLGAERELPRFVTQNGRHALIVDGAPFLMLGAQANNSSNYPAALERVWPMLEAMHANTLEIPVAWEQIEPVEGQFDFSYVDALVREARAHNMRLVLLWFGTWKNTSPNYTPSWVKLNNERFPRMITRDGATHYALSPHHQATLDADSRAFAALMRHLKRIDGAEQTVIMVQVQNEPGSYRSVRDYGPAAQALFNAQVPTELVRAMEQEPGTWTEVFGRDADEYFHAWHMARFMEQVAMAGQVEYALPMYTNAALRDPINPQDANSYASGGPTWNVIQIYKTAAPTLSVLAPDLYDRRSAIATANFDRYQRPDNPLMIVEIGNDPAYARYFFEVFGRGGVGFAPFGMDETGYSNYPLGTLTEGEARAAPFATLYEVLAPMSRDWARIAFEHPTWGVAKPDDSADQTLDLGSRWNVRVQYDQFAFGESEWFRGQRLEPAPNLAAVSGGAMIAELGENEYLLIAQNARVSFELDDPRAVNGVIFDRVEEGRFVDGEWVTDRVWNGDQTDYGLNFTQRPQVLRVKLATY